MNEETKAFPVIKKTILKTKHFELDFNKTLRLDDKETHGKKWKLQRTVSVLTESQKGEVVDNLTMIGKDEIKIFDK